MTDPSAESLHLSPVARALPGRRVIHEQTEALIDQLASELMEVALRRVHEAGRFHLALSGGSTPRALYRRLMVDPAYRHMPWSRTHLWQVDERCVPADDERSNLRMLRELIADPSDIPDSGVHPMPATEVEGDRRYENELRTALEAAPHDGRLDFVLLGMGGDGHTASLFPNTPALDERERWVLFNDGESIAEPRPRMTLTYPCINAARHLAILVTGEGKHGALQHASVAFGAGTPQPQWPITGIVAERDDTKMAWYLDRAAVVGPGEESSG